MTSFQFAPSPRKRKVARFITRVRRELQKAFMEEKAARGLTQAKLARTLGSHRSIVCRQLAGSANLTLRTLADYAWALDRDLLFSLEKPSVSVGSNADLHSKPAKEQLPPGADTPGGGANSSAGVT